MTGFGSVHAPKGAAGGVCRPSRRRQRARGPEWVRPYRRAQRALDSAASLIFSTIHAAIDAGRGAERRPVRTARRLNGAMRGMAVASLRLIDARRELAEASEALTREPEQQTGDAPELMELAAARCRAVAEYIPFAVNKAIFAQVEVLGGLGTGELVPERPSDDRRRIVITPRPLFVRAFLAVRQPRVSDRIAPVLLRRRRTPCPAEVRVPRRSLQGRAPPLSSTCAL
ncbi:MAG TPA: hypothetical protein VNI54_06610 [Thermoanaerobaculia bacterium]|nr:hypothetical protein [Thermoanaerobaculia bacterium]